MRIKLRATKKNQSRPVFDMSKLRKQETQREFALELKNRINILENTHEDTEDDIEKEWQNINETYCETSRKVLGFGRRKDKEWITTETWQKIQRKKPKTNLLSANLRHLWCIWKYIPVIT